MINIARSFPVNEVGEIRLTRSDVWAGLLMKARDATLFVRGMQECVVLEDEGDRLLRQIRVRDEVHQEEVTFIPEKTVTFTRVAGNTIGSIVNEIKEDRDGNLALEFVFNLESKELEPGSEAEREHFGKVEAEYEDAIRTTLETIRESKSANG